MSFTVHLTDSARDDIRAILRWIENRSVAGAATWYRRWLEVLETIRERGGSMGLAPESQSHSDPIQQIIFKTKRGLPYRALFSVREKNLFILHVRGPGQDLLPRQNLK